MTEKEYKAKWYQDNKERTAPMYKARYKKHKDEINAKRREKYIENKDEILARNKIYRDEHKEQKAVGDKLYREKNKENIAKQRKVYKTNNKKLVAKQKKESSERNKETIIAYRQTEKYRISSINTRAKRKANKMRCDGTIPKKVHTVISKDLLKLLHGQKHKCNMCRCAIAKELNNIELDHYIPLSKGGMHSITNVQWLCSHCNNTKSNSVPIIPLMFQLP